MTFMKQFPAKSIFYLVPSFFRAIKRYNNKLFSLSLYFYINYDLIQNFEDLENFQESEKAGDRYSWKEMG